jgi:hypothetical protein
MIFEFENSIPQAFTLVSSFFFPKPPVWILGILCFVILPFFFKKQDSWPAEHQAKIVLAIGSAFLLFSYLLTQYEYIDEVFVNLEHPYNLLHHGKFSFSPKQMVDGTVEVFYYLLLAPFAWSREALIKSSLVLGFLFLWGQLYLLWRYSKKTFGIAHLLLITSFFSLFFPFVNLSSSGFGAGMISFLFLLCVYFQAIPGNAQRALLIASFFPLIRPEGIAYSLMVIAVHGFRTKKIPVYFLFLPCVSMGIYFALFKIFYGHFIPTPLLFKSVYWDHSMAFVNTGRIWRRIHPYAFKIIFYAALYGISYFVSRLRKDNSEMSRLFRNYGIFVMGMALLDIVMSSFMPGGRYLIGYRLLSILFFLPLAANLVLKLIERFCFGSKILKMTLLSTFIFIIAISQVMTLRPIRERGRSMNYLGIGGQLVERFVPNSWSVSAGEINTFGFMNDRETIDFYGYTNREIAQSKELNAEGSKFKPGIFLKTRPDIFFMHWGNYRPAGPYEKLFSVMYFQKKYSLLGDPLDVLKKYDLFVIRDPHLTREPLYMFLVKKNRSTEFVNALSPAYKNIGQREIDVKAVQYFFSQP